MTSPDAPKVSADLLRTLHRIQRQLSDLRGRLDRGPKKIKNAEAHAANQAEQLERVRQELTALRMAADAKQVQQKSSDAKVKDLQLKLNAAGSNREYQALQEQIAAVKMANSVLDDEILEAWDRIEAHKQMAVAAEGDLKKAQAKAEQVRQEVQGQEAKIRADVAGLEAELKQHEAGLTGDARLAYDRMVRQRGEDALAAIENQCCGGCFTLIPINIVSEVMLGQPTVCKSCGRLLYFPEDGQPG